MSGNHTVAWKRVSHFYNLSRKPINVLVAYHADAAAASLTITTLLKSSLIDFCIHPISDYDELSEVVQQANLNQDYTREELRAAGELDEATISARVDELFFLIGFGGELELNQHFDFSRHIVVVLDSNRPFHLRNLREIDQYNKDSESPSTHRLLLWDQEAIVEEVDTFFRKQREEEARGVLLSRRKRQRQQQQQRSGRQPSPGEAVGKNKLSKRRHKRTKYQTDENSNLSHGSAKKGSRRVTADESTTGLIGESEEAPMHAQEDEGAEEEDSLRSSSYSDSESSLFSSDSEEDDDDSDICSEDDLSSIDDDAYENEEDVPLSQDQYIHWRNPEEIIPSYLETIYYSIDGGGKSCAVLAYELAVLLNRVREPFLWHAAVGVCDLFLRKRIDYGSYLAAMRPIHDAVSLYRANHHRSYLEERGRDEANQQLQGSRRAAQVMQLRNLDDEQLLLLRHTNLWDAIWYHPVTASVLGLHHAEDGEGFLSQLLASRCGVSRANAQRPWRELPEEDRRDALPRVLEELQHIFTHKASFISHPVQIRTVSRVIGFSAEVSAFDACHLFTATLCSVAPDGLTLLQDRELALDEAAGERLVTQRLKDYQRQLFWRAREVLDVDPNLKEFNVALAESFQLQRAVAEATSALMQPGMLQSTKGIHYAQPSELAKTTSALENFNTIYRLQRLSERLLHTLTVERGTSRFTQQVRPLLLSCITPRVRRLTVSSGLGSSYATTTTTEGTLSGSIGNTNQTNTAAKAGDAPMLSAFKYVVLLSHEGGGNGPSPSVGRYRACVEDREEFDRPPQRHYPAAPQGVLVADRESAAHVAELLHLRSIQPWRPRQEMLKALKLQQMAAQYQQQSPNDRHSGDNDEDENNNNNSKTHLLSGRKAKHGDNSGANAVEVI